MTDSYNQESINLASKNLNNSGFQFLVGPPGSGAQFTSIQAAIDAAGDRTVENVANVIVLGGQYTENITMRRAVFVSGFPGVQIIGSVTFDIPIGTVDPDDNFGLMQNVVIQPPAGVTGIIVTGTDFQTVIIESLIVITDGAPCIDLSNSGTSGGNSSASTIFAGQFTSDGASTIVQSDGFAFLGSAQIAREDNTVNAISATGGGHIILNSRIEGDISIAAGTVFAQYGYTEIQSDLQPALVNDAFVFLEQCAVQSSASPPLTGTGALLYTGLCYSGGGIGIDGTFAFTVDPGQAYQPFLGGAAAAWAPPIPDTVGQAIDRIAVALSTSVAAGGGIPPF